MSDETTDTLPETLPEPLDAAPVDTATAPVDAEPAVVEEPAPEAAAAGEEPEAEAVAEEPDAAAEPEPEPPPPPMTRKQWALNAGIEHGCMMPDHRSYDENDETSLSPF